MKNGLRINHECIVAFGGKVSDGAARIKGIGLFVLVLRVLEVPLLFIPEAEVVVSGRVIRVLFDRMPEAIGSAFDLAELAEPDAPVHVVQSRRGWLLGLLSIR